MADLGMVVFGRQVLQVVDVVVERHQHDIVRAGVEAPGAIHIHHLGVPLAIADRIQIWGEIDRDVFKAQSFDALEVELITVAQGEAIEHGAAIKGLLTQVGCAGGIDAGPTIDREHVGAADGFEIEEIRAATALIDPTGTEGRANVAIAEIIAGLVAKLVAAPVQWLDQRDRLTEGLQNLIVMTA